MSQHQLEHLVEKEGWYIKAEALNKTEKLQMDSLQDSLSMLLDSDLRTIGRGCFPESIIKQQNSMLRGPYVVQLVSIRNILQPKFGCSQKALLLIVVTDGKRCLRCLDYKGVGSVPNNMFPGTKLKINGGNIRHGILLIDDGCLEVLGGRVQSLIDEWNFNKRTGQTRTKYEEDEQAPPFKHFDPKKAAKNIELGDFSTFATLEHSNEPRDGAEGSSARVSIQAGSLRLFNNREAVQNRLLEDVPEPSTIITGQKKHHKGTNVQAPKTLTLDEFEAQQHKSKQINEDECLAQELEKQLTLQTTETTAQDLMNSMFSYTPAQSQNTESTKRGRGQHRGRSRGGRKGRRGKR